MTVDWCVTGHYYYTEWCQSCVHGDIARMTSPWYVARQPSCLSFYYHMKGHPTDMGPIYVLSVDPIGVEKVHIRGCVCLCCTPGACQCIKLMFMEINFRKLGLIYI